MKTQEISIENLLKMNNELNAEVERLNQQIQWLMSQLRLSKHKQFGASSEQTNVNQMCLFNEAASRRRNHSSGTERTGQGGAVKELYVALPHQWRSKTADCAL